MRNVVWLVVFLSASLISCGHKPPEPDFCDLEPRVGDGKIVSAHCPPTKAGKPEYDKSVQDMSGYRCTSPEDTGNIKSFIRKVLNDIENNLHKFSSPLLE